MFTQYFPFEGFVSTQNNPADNLKNVLLKVLLSGSA
jgi:hypothetical protein